MIKTKNEQSKDFSKNEQGNTAFTLFNLKEFEGVSDNLKQYSYVEIEKGQEVSYHVHNGDADYYYIVSGKGLYNDNGKEIEVGAGTITYTPSGEGHALKNVGEDKLCFIALVIKD